TSLSESNERRPIVPWMMPALSTRNCTWPALAFFTAVATSGVTVPTFGFGIRPRGPRIWPSVPTTRIVSGDAITTSKLMLPALTSASASLMAYSFRLSTLPCRASLFWSAWPCSDSFHRHAHRTGRASDDAHRAVEVSGVQILHLGLRDVLELRAGQLADLVEVRARRALFELDGLLDQHTSRRRLDQEREGLVGEGGDHHR